MDGVRACDGTSMMVPSSTQRCRARGCGQKRSCKHFVSLGVIEGELQAPRDSWASPPTFAVQRAMRTPNPRASLLCAIAAFGCSDDALMNAGRSSEDGKNNANNPGTSGCGRDSDCPLGLICVEARCVSPEDLLPPDVEEGFETRPVGTERVLFALSTNSDSVAVIDPATLAITTVDLPPEPLALVGIPGRDAAVVLSREGRAMSLVERASDGEVTFETHRILRRFNRVSISPDGLHAVAWTGGDEPPDEGAEGIVTILSLESGASREVAAGYRHTGVYFRDGSGGTSAIVAGKDEVAVIELVTEDARARRTRLPDAFAEVLGREIVAAPDGRYLLIRSFAEHGIGVLEVDTSTLSVIALPSIPTDLDLIPSGARAVVAMRAASEIAIVDLPEALSSSSAIRVFAVEGLVAGQLEVAADGRHAAAFSTQDDIERFGWIDLDTGVTRAIDRLKKLVRQIGLSPDGKNAIVVHRPNAGSTVADSYERAVDLDEGYSVVDLETGDAQLKRTGGVPAQELVFSATGRTAALTLRLDAIAARRVEAVDLSTLVVDAYSLASAPEFAGSLPESPGSPSERFWVTQVHPAGRISFLDAEAKRISTATGFQLNAGISGGR